MVHPLFLTALWLLGCIPVVTSFRNSTGCLCGSTARAGILLLAEVKLVQLPNRSHGKNKIKWFPICALFWVKQRKWLVIILKQQQIPTARKLKVVYYGYFSVLYCFYSSSLGQERIWNKCRAVHRQCCKLLVEKSGGNWMEKYWKRVKSVLTRNIWLKLQLHE